MQKLDNKEQKCVCDFDETFMNIFVEVFNKKLWENFFFFKETKTEAFLEKCGHTY